MKNNLDNSILEYHRSILEFSFMDTKTFGGPNFESLMVRKLDIFLKIIKFSGIKPKWYWYYLI